MKQKKTVWIVLIIIVLVASLSIFLGILYKNQMVAKQKARERFHSRAFEVTVAYLFSGMRIP